ncbi:hypothetical protein BDV96DRAFT_613119 [Lophiotrema nucula]|uniref:PLD phosphodiesterase domain-containing protein n=1 Tax=Lophiotrema nucula TaxID=690887 RepID=A0A6A5Z6G0_9PLEO|nr:hypothetical protein BDV96DRAFT_613119 [Lophiotrema nucula]
MAPNHPPITTPFLSTLDSAATQNANDDPNYYVQDPKSLVSTSTVHSFTTGTGSAIYQSLIPLLESTAQELVLVTCFWARSSTLETLSAILRTLSDKAIYRGGDKIRVRLCFSSLSLFQKLFHSQTTDGQLYPKSVWMKKLGFPSPRDLGGLDLQIKSIFLLPFSVMHPKFMIIDRQKVVLPSCNISWEEWFEGGIVMSGAVVNQFLRFYEEFWERSELPALRDERNPPNKTNAGDAEARTKDHGHAHLQLAFSSDRGHRIVKDIPTVFLPSPHRRNPVFKPFTPSERIIAPPTPLNLFILTLFSKATKSIRIQTPNVTSPPVLSALLKALARGIDVRILTSEKLMVLEQLVTAGTTTVQCMRKLIKRYQKLRAAANGALETDEEAAIASPRPGRLHISYFKPLGGPKSRGEEDGEPQQSHLKMTIVDGEVLVLGSGNLDRASWFTSQELDIALFDRTLAESVGKAVDEAMNGRERNIFNSRGGYTI